MGTFGVSPKKEKNLKERMDRLGVSEADLRETFIHASGPGGQKVNKAATGVHLVHVPTGVAVKCTTHRSQSINRFLARCVLLDRIEEMTYGFIEEKEKERERIRRQKERRNRRRKNKKGSESRCTLPLP
jgi:protein subunit release factor B